MSVEQKLANAIRALSIDAVEQAKSGHPGMPLGMADIAVVLFKQFLQHNPANPSWSNRDRFVLSNGHGSMLLYSLLHLTGYDLSIEEIKNFRQLHSKTPGHPEYKLTPGIETTTGPLGQGIANAVGMAIAEKSLSAQFNRTGYGIVDHHTYAFVGDGCLMEGISHEVCSLAGTLGLGKLIVVWDDNGISIDGEVRRWCGDDTASRFRAYGWQVIESVDGHDSTAVTDALTAARANTTQPTIICARTTIGFGSPKLAGSEKSHGAPLGADELKATKKSLGWEHPAFHIPEEIYAEFSHLDIGKKLEENWQKLFNEYSVAHPELSREYLRRVAGELEPEFASNASNFIAKLQQENKAMASRKASLVCLEEFGKYLPEFLGGSADLTGSNLTKRSESKVISKEDFSGNYLHYGVREFGMSAIMNGIALHGGFIPYGGTFLTFLDYAKNATRMSALMHQRVIYVFTHDSIGLGEDGPTHQPIEHLSSLRLIPNLETWRPADSVETAVAWQAAILNSDKPTALALSRQTIAPQTRTKDMIANIARGGYVLWQDNENIESIIIATGSELELATDAAKTLAGQGVSVAVVSMPSVERFLQQDAHYQASVLPAGIKNRVVIEAGSSDLWYRFVGEKGKVLGIDRFGESAPSGEVYKYLGITTDAIVDTVKQLINK